MFPYSLCIIRNLMNDFLIAKLHFFSIGKIELSWVPRQEDNKSDLENVLCFISLPALIIIKHSVRLDPGPHSGFGVKSSAEELPGSPSDEEDGSYPLHHWTCNKRIKHSSLRIGPFREDHLLNSKFQRKAVVSGSINETPDNLAPAPETSKFAAGFWFLKKTFARARIYSSNAAVLSNWRSAPTSDAGENVCCFNKLVILGEEVSA